MSEVILVLGMHRSGTSAVSGALTKLGGAAPRRLMAVHESNERGFFESPVLMEFHDEILASAGSAWDDWRLFNPLWLGSSTGAEFKRRAKALFAEEFGAAAMPVLKDPRICRFVPFWLDVLREMELTPRIVMPVRTPLDVAFSLKAAKGMSLSKGLLLWLRHCLDAEAQSRSEARSIFAWTDFHKDWRAVCEKISADAHFSWPRQSDRATREIDLFLTRELVHHESDRDAFVAHPDAHEWAVSAYEALLELGRNPHSNSAMATLDQIRAQFEQSSKVFGRVLVDYEVEIEDLREQTLAAGRERDALNMSHGEEMAASAAAAKEWTLRAKQAEIAHKEARRELGVLAQQHAEALSALDLSKAERDQISARLLNERNEAFRNMALLSSRFDATNAARLESERRTEEMSRDLEQARRQEGALHSALEDTSASLAQSNAALQATDAERARATSELSDTQAALAEIARKHAETQATLEFQSAELAALQAERADLAAALKQAAAQLELAQQSADDQACVRLDHENQIQALRREIVYVAQQSADDQASVETDHENQMQALRRQIVDAAQQSADDQASVRIDHQNQIQALRRQFVDAEAAAANAAAQRFRKGLLPVALRRRLVARRLVRSGLFDIDFYRAAYPDAGESGLDAVAHYLEQGFCNGYRPNPLFDTRWYLERYEDVRRAGVNPLLHYLFHGHSEGRDPGPDFETNFYLESNPDVAASGVNSLSHYLRHGKNEGRLPVRPV